MEKIVEDVLTQSHRAHREQENLDTDEHGFAQDAVAGVEMA